MCDLNIHKASRSGGPEILSFVSHIPVPRFANIKKKIV